MFKALLGGGILLFALVSQTRAQGIWTPTGNMGAARSYLGGFTLTRLCNGKVLATGGGGATGAGIASAELYDPATGVWTPIAPMTFARIGHSATLLPDCKVLVAGGYGAPHPQILNSAELYDPVSGTWSITGSFSTGRSAHTAVLLNNGKVLIAAGSIPGSGDTFGTASSEIYDPSTGTWSSTGSLLTARMHQSGVLLSDGRVLVAGGQPAGVTFDNFSSAEVYDPVLGTWLATGSMAIGRRGAFTLTRLSDGKILVAGGYTNWTAIDTAIAEIYDPSTGVWTPTTPLPATRNAYSTTLLPDGTVLLAGGNHHPQDFGLGTNLNTALIYDPIAQTWLPTANAMSEARSYHREALLLDGSVLIAGGHGIQGEQIDFLTTAELFGSGAPLCVDPPMGMVLSLIHI